MAVKKKSEADEFQAWKDKIASEGSEEEQAAFAKFIEGSVGKQLIKGSLMMDEFHRRMNDLHQQKLALDADEVSLSNRVSEIDKWYEINKPVNDKLKQEKSRLAGELEEARQQLEELGLAVQGNGKRGAPVNDELREEFETLKREKKSLEDQVMRMDNNFPQVVGTLLDVTWRGMLDGYKDVSPKDVLQHAIKKGIDPYAAYDELTAPERQRREKETYDKEIEKIRKEAREEGRREVLKSSIASPDRLRSATPFFEQVNKSRGDEAKFAAKEEAISMLDEALTEAQSEMAL